MCVCVVCVCVCVYVCVCVFTPLDKKNKTTLKNEEKDVVYNFFNYENQIYKKISLKTFKFKIRRNFNSFFIAGKSQRNFEGLRTPYNRLSTIT